MPPSTGRIAARIAERIALSVHTVEIAYPAIAPVPAGTGALVTSAPSSPLTGPKTPRTLIPGLETRPPNATFPVLWLDATTESDLTTSVTRARPYGWLEGAHAMARVRPSDAAAFHGADYVTHLIGEDRRERFRVLQVTPIGASGATPSSHAVWLTLAAPAPAPLAVDVTPPSDFDAALVASITPEVS